MVIRVIDLVTGCDTADQGDVVFPIIAAALRRGDVVTVSFAGISTATSSFVNTALVALLQEFDLGQLKARLRFADSTRQINEMIRLRLFNEAARMARVA